MNGTGDHYVKQDKPSSERQISHFHSYVESRPKKIMWHDCKKGTIWEFLLRGMGRERMTWGRYDMI
jgi:hypothetical protein